MYMYVCMHATRVEPFLHVFIDSDIKTECGLHSSTPHTTYGVCMYVHLHASMYVYHSLAVVFFILCGKYQRLHLRVGDFEAKSPINTVVLKKLLLYYTILHPTA